jgi:hypothetical protein
MPVFTLFGDEQGLLRAMHREGFRRLGAALRAVPLTADPVADLTGLGLAYRQAALAGPHLYGLMFGGLAPGPDRTRSARRQPMPPPSRWWTRSRGASGRG